MWFNLFNNIDLLKANMPTIQYDNSSVLSYVGKIKQNLHRHDKIVKWKMINMEELKTLLKSENVVTFFLEKKQPNILQVLNLQLLR